MKNLLIKNKKIFRLLIVLFFGGILFFFLGQMYYDTKKDTFSRKVENAFRNALQDKLQEKSFESHLYTSKRKQEPKKLPDTIYIYDAEGMHAYPLNKDKNSINITQDPNIRIMHSEFLSTIPIAIDSLYEKWSEYLMKEELSGTFVLKLSLSDKKDSVTTSIFPEVPLDINLQQCFRLTIGYRCEVEIYGFYNFTLTKQGKTLEIIIYCLLYWLCVIGIYGITNHLKGKEKRLFALNQKEKEKLLEKQIKYVENGSTHCYQLSENIFFYADEKKLVIDGKESSMFPQCAYLLQHFLDAPDYIMKDEEIASLFWSEKCDNTNNIYNLIGRLRRILKKTPFIKIDRYKISSYQLRIVKQ